MPPNEPNSWDRQLARTTRGLPFRLTLSYAVFFTLMLAVVGVLFRGALQSRLDAGLREVLDQEWAAMKAYLRVEDGRVTWFFDREDPDEAAIVARMRRLCLLADGEGRTIEASELSSSLNIETPARITERVRAASKTAPTDPVWLVKQSPTGQNYLVRTGIVLGSDANHQPFFMAVGRSMADNERVIDQFTRLYLIAMPFLIFGGSLIGWILTNRALEPVMRVAGAAQRISGSNLSLRIPERGTRDQVDTLTATINEMIARLERSFGQMRQFSADVSHELRTPLTAARGQLEVALLTATTAEQFREAIANSLEDLERLGEIIRKLHSLAQAESGQVTLQRAPHNLPPLVEGVIDQFEIAAEEAGVHIEWLPEGDCPAEVDRVQFERLVSNLLSNAIKFTPPRGVVRVGLRRQGDRAELTVVDSGRGIAAEHLPHIFDRFYRVGGGGSGLGLGLSFVNWIVKAHGGSIDVSSILGGGTTFVVNLPAEAPPMLDEARAETMNHL